jgi:hypothetical protein
MTRAALALLVATALAAGCGGTRTVTQTVTAPRQGLGTPDEAVFFGHIRSLVSTRGGFRLEVDPASFLTGVTAKRAKLEDTGESDVPNDYYIRDEGHRLLTYVVPRTARATVLVGGLNPVAIPVSELAQIVAGRNPEHRQLYDRAGGLGYWIRARGDTVRSLDQQYQP